MINKKKLIAYSFVLIMIVSAFAGLASIIPANASSHITPSVTGSGTGSGESETVTVNLGICGDVTGSANVSHSTYDIGQQILRKGTIKIQIISMKRHKAVCAQMWISHY